MRRHPLIAVTNHSTVLSDADVQAALPALQHQVTYHFEPRWNAGATLQFATQDRVDALLHAGAWEVAILDDSDQAGALGYHDLATVPTGKVFAKTDREYGLSWTVTASHELLEMLADPYISAAWQTSNTEFTACEVGDPVEADQYGYTVGGVLLSDFILPAWYGEEAAPVGPYDYAGHLSRPLELLPGGYISKFVSGRGWTTQQLRKGKLVDVESADVSENARFRDRSRR